MISLMYLVLTAMLALNVDKSVIDAFVLVDEGFMQTIQNFNDKNQQVYTRFNNAAQENKQKAGALNDTVNVIKTRTDSLYNYVTHFKEMIVKLVDGPKGKINDIVAKEDMHFSEQVMITYKNGTLLKNAINTYREFLISKIDTSEHSLIASIRKNLDTSDPPVKEGATPSWEYSKFAGYPVIAVITLMSKMQSDIRNSEADVINYLFTRIDASSYKFNKLKAQVIAKSDYVLQGDNYEANVFISAVDTTAVPEIIVNGNRLPIVPGENAGLYRASANAEGTFKWKGIINFKNPNGIVDQYPFEHEYQVAKPSTTISPTKMNVLYAGLKNPISISAPGISSRDLIVSMTNGTIERTADGFLAFPSKPGEKTIISVSATVDGKAKEMGSILFRVKPVPKPQASVGGKSEGFIDKGVIVAEQGVFAEIPEFDFDMKFTVLSFTVSASQGSFTSELPTNGNRFSQQQKDLFKQLNKGSRLYIDNIVAKGDDGLTRTLSPLSFKIN
jgi:gliding motility-associated protein GldM